jgi:signal transduction histidine kinase
MSTAMLIAEDKIDMKLNPLTVVADFQSPQQRERLWAASARVSRIFLKAQDVMAAMPQVLRELGEAAGVDRTVLALAEIGPGNQRWLVVRSEWLADGIAEEFADIPRVWNVRKPDGFCAQLRTGRSVYICHNEIESLNDTSIASEFAKSSMLVPFLVDDEYLGVIGFDNCRQTREFEPAVVSALEIAASFIGAALHREKLIEAVRHERELATEQRAAELSKANTALRANLERLASSPDPHNFFGHMLLEMVHQLQAAAGTVVALTPAGDEWRVMAHVRDGQHENPPFPSIVANSPALTEQWQDGCREPRYVAVDDYANKWPGVYEYHKAHGHQCCYKLPLVFGEHIVGFITLAFHRAEALNVERIELLAALGQQATLAIGLKRLAISAKDAAVLAERNRIGREIHDGLAQAFTGILMQLGAAEEMAHGSPLTPLLTRIGDIAREGLNEARRSVLALRPDEARPGGLELALRQLAERSTVPSRVTCRFEGSGVTTGLVPEHEHALLRIAQEAVTNAVRHAQPDTIKIALQLEGEQLVLRVSDDGLGMTHLPERYAQQGFGLTNMRERAQAIGGSWQIDSSVGRGTLISVRIPRQASLTQNPLSMRQSA